MSLVVDVVIARRDFQVEVSFEVQAGERFVLFGPSGAGKSSILEAVAGLVVLSKGTISLNGTTLTDVGPPYSSVEMHRRKVGLLRQDPAIFSHLSVGANAGYAQKLAPTSPVVSAMLDRLGLSGLNNAAPADLSGGQRQRVALARVLLSGFKTLLMDEPYSSLDSALRRELIVTAAGLSGQVPSILVTHDLEEAQSYGDRIAIINEGRILQIDDPVAIVARPTTKTAAQMVGYRSFIAHRGHLAAIHPDNCQVSPRGDDGIEISGRVLSVVPAGTKFETAIDPQFPALLSGEGGAIDSVVLRLDHRVNPGDEVTMFIPDPPLVDPQ